MGWLNLTLEENVGRGNTASVITELGIGNFKAFGEMQRVPIKPLTLIFGANSSGKSSIIHSLLLAHHGLEKGTLDAHQTSLGGESVDLGGFRQYVHRHEINRRVSLYLEKPAPEHTSWEGPNPSAPYRAAFGGAKCVGVTFHVGLLTSPAGVAEGTGEPAILRLEVVINGHSLLELERAEANIFRVSAVKHGHPFLDAIAREVMAYSTEKILSLQNVGLEDHPDEEREKLEKENLKRIESDPFLSRVALAKSDEQAAKAELSLLKQTLTRILGERKYGLDGLVLKDAEPDPWWDWVGGQQEMEYSGPVDFLREHQSDFGTSDTWWPEAQAIRYDLNRLLSGRFDQLRDDLRKLSYLGPLRCVPSRHVTSVRDQDPNWLASGGAAWEQARQDPKVVEVVNEWLGPAGLGTNYRIIAKQMVEAEKLLLALNEQPGAYGQPLPLSAEEILRNHPEMTALTELLFEDMKVRTVVSHRDIGFGVSQVLPVLVTALASRARLIAIEQPELHLHPALQAELGDVFIESALGERKNTFLLETHSEHLILRVLRRVRETTEGKLPAGATPVRPEDVSVVFVEPTAQGSIVRQLPVTPDGDFAAPWPGGFFAERFQDLP